MHWTNAAEEAGRIAQDWTTEGGPGGAIILFDRQDIRAEAAGGLASLEGFRRFDADSVVRYASVSKHFLCATLLRTGAIGFDDPLGAHLSLPHPLADVTVGRALDMTGGLPDAMEMLWLLGVSPTTSLDRHALLRFVSGFDALNFAPGTEISYSNTGYRLVQAALEAKLGPYDRLLADHFFRPLGLSIRLPEDETDPVPELAAGYWRGPRGWQRGRYGLHFSASGGLAGSGRDLAVWAQAMLADSGPAEDLLPPLGALRHLEDGRPTGYGLGLARAPLGNALLIGHGGSLPGYKNHFLLAPARGAGVVVVSNREDTDAQTLALRVMSVLLGIPRPDGAAGLLPAGRFVAEEGPFWLDQEAGTATFLGAAQVLHAGEDGWAESNSAHLPMRLHAENGYIDGEIGHAS
ncbi:MAG TPA: serine hydrolase domain-containing protein, partial [Acetobacteraceae bacterium]